MEKFSADSYLPFVSSARGVQYPSVTLGSLTCLRSSVDPISVFIFTCFFVYAVDPSIPKTRNIEERDMEISFQVWFKWYSFINAEGHPNSFCDNDVNFVHIRKTTSDVALQSCNSQRS